LSRKSVLRLAVGLGVVAALVLAVLFLPLKHWATIFIMWVRGFGVTGTMVYALVYITGTILLIPGTALTAGAGLVYGPILGTLIVSPASVIGATLAFLIARHFARVWVESKLRQYPKFDAIDRAIEKNGFKIILLLRLEPVFIPFALLNYGLGLTSVRLRDYVLASWLGMLPATALYVYLGSALHNVADVFEGKLLEAGMWGKVVFWGGLVAAAVLVLLLGRIARKALREELRQAPQSERSPA
jgi:uncharacterized membrane protein YdjX (TVP38/TMEM64 family)